MAEPEWELLTVRGLGMTDESAAEFAGTFVIHRVGSQPDQRQHVLDLLPIEET